MANRYDSTLVSVETCRGSPSICNLFKSNRRHIAQAGKEVSRRTEASITSSYMPQNFSSTTKSSLAVQRSMKMHQKVF